MIDSGTGADTVGEPVAGEAVPARLPVRVGVATPMAPVSLASRATTLVRAGIRNPAVLVSATAVATLVAEIGLRLLQHGPGQGGGVPRSVGKLVEDPALVLTETWTMTRRVEVHRRA